MTTAGAAPYWASFRRMPLVLQAYAAFAVGAAVLWCLALAALLLPSVNRHIAPYGGVTSLSGYLFTLYFIFAIPTQPRRWTVFALAPLVSIVLISGVTDMLRLLSDTNVAHTAQTTNPFLQYAPLRPVLNIVVPLFWILMICSPQVWRWARARETDRQFQSSLLDLFYLIFVCALCISLSIGLTNYVHRRHAVGAKMAQPGTVPQASPPATPSNPVRP
jgi:glucan phosphoethanolaminetransferase (alkaline phosphatase superfamily)